MPRHRRAQRVPRAPVMVAAVLAVVVALTAVVFFLWPGSDPDGPGGDSPVATSDNPLSGIEFYVNPANPAAQQARQWESAGRTEDAAAMRKIADRPIAQWFASDDGRVRTESARLAEDAEQEGRSALLVAYYVPHRDCGQYSSGGASDADDYRAWINELATGLTGHTATVILEPDAIAHTLDNCMTDETLIAERYTLLREAIVALKRNPDVTVYVDAGNASWIKDINRMEEALRQVGVTRADGFALNVSNFETTEASVDYGNTLSAALGDAHFVIDTSRNGNGPYTETSDEYRWCNPPGRALGTPPTTDTGIDRVDAFLWIKQPGDSDGACREGAPAAGQWWPEYALTLAKGS